MTNEEAIRVLNVAKAECEWNAPLEYQEAFDAAIKALIEQSKHNQNTMSKQPDLDTLGIKTGETCADAISRQAAIDALIELYEYQRDIDPTEAADLVRQGIYLAEKKIEQLPAAQLEHTCVNCGRTVNNGGWYADGRTRCPIEEHYALPKDGYCHLWEKRNITDDDYPERREE